MNLKVAPLTIIFLVLILMTIFAWPQKLESLIPLYSVNEILDDKLTVDVAPYQTQLVATSTLFLVGDLMLGRHVEFLMNKNGADYPYKKLDFLKAEPAYVIGNFESAIPSQHQKTPNFGMRFSVAKEFLPALKSAGFTHMGLANNHSLDAGELEFSNTQQSLMAVDIFSFGHPSKISTSSVTKLNLGDKRIAVVAIHTLYTLPSEEDLNSIFVSVAEDTDWQIAYVHWGVEYTYWPTSSQRKLAQSLVKYGADLVVGHHPHVIQQVDTIAGVPVFYSLGNLIFDQYFSKDVQTGLVLKLIANEKGINLSAIPVTSINTPAQPRLMTGMEIDSFYQNLADFNTNETLALLHKSGLNLSWSLASSTEMAIIDQ